jgi:hypothetical protein
MSFIYKIQVFNIDGIWIVPQHVYSVSIKAIGGGGGGGYQLINTPISYGGGGGLVSASFNVTPGQELKIYIGGGGGTTPFHIPGTCSYKNGSGNGGTVSDALSGGCGGALTCVTANNDTSMFIIAGGGGGGASYFFQSPSPPPPYITSGFGGGNRDENGGNGYQYTLQSGGMSNGIGGLSIFPLQLGGSGGLNGINVGKGASSVSTPNCSGGGGGYGGGGVGMSVLNSSYGGGGGGSSFVNKNIKNNMIPTTFSYINIVTGQGGGPGAGGGHGAGGSNTSNTIYDSGHSGQVTLKWIVYIPTPTHTPTPTLTHNNEIVCNQCPLPIFSKLNTSFGGNNNIQTTLNTKAARYSQLVSLPFRAQNSGSVVFISTTNDKCITPPKNTF